MRRKLFSALFLVTALSIALGAFGHGHQWSKHVLPVVAGLDPGMIRLLALIWFWVSATMLVFGFLLVWTWWRIGRGERNLLVVPWTIGAMYCTEGVYGALHLGAFFLLFVLQAVLLCGSAWALRGPASVETPGQVTR
jgi:hypothetical protein